MARDYTCAFVSPTCVRVDRYSAHGVKDPLESYTVSDFQSPIDLPELQRISSEHSTYESICEALKLRARMAPANENRGSPGDRYMARTLERNIEKVIDAGGPRPGAEHCSD